MKKEFDILLFLPIVGLSIFSLFNLFGIKNSLFFSQLIFFFVGFFFLFIFYQLGTHFFKLNSKSFYYIVLVLLVISFVIGIEVKGSKRWIDFYFFRFQPSEFLKVFFIIYLADLFEKKNASLTVSFLFFLIPVAIIFKQPDLGNTLVYILLYGSILFFIGTSMRYFIYPLGFFIISLPVIWKMLANYQKNRILSFINPNIDPGGVSYNLIQSIITIGSGGFFGRGLGLGTQSKFLFLPENHTDFVYASLVEQFGFIGGILTIFLYSMVVYRLIKKSFYYQKERFIFLFLIGTITLFISQVFINVGMNLGILPITGISLPLLSYGGSSIASTMMILGLALSL